MPDPWPWHADSPLDRARRVACNYRDALAHRDPEACRTLDDKVRGLGQGWIVAQPVVYDHDDLLTVDEVAEMTHVRPGTVAQWRRRGLVATNTPDGFRYRVADVLAYHAQRRRRRGSVGKRE